MSGHTHTAFCFLFFTPISCSPGPRTPPTSPSKSAHRSFLGSGSCSAREEVTGLGDWGSGVLTRMHFRYDNTVLLQKAPWLCCKAGFCWGDQEVSWDLFSVLSLVPSFPTPSRHLSFLCSVAPEKEQKSENARLKKEHLGDINHRDSALVGSYSAGPNKNAQVYLTRKKPRNSQQEPLFRYWCTSAPILCAQTPGTEHQLSSDWMVPEAS